MWKPDVNAIAERLSHDFGLRIEGVDRPRSGGWPAFELSPAETPREISFSVEVVLGWRTITFSLAPGAFAGPLMHAMGEADEGARGTFRALAEVCTRARATVSLNVNGIELDPAQTGSWPQDWQRARLTLVKSPAIVNTEDQEANDRELHTWTHRYLSLALALMPVEELEPEMPPDLEGLPEGARVRIEANRYERSRINRAACIEIHGDSCQACGFNFGDVYGKSGRGFIHVHHITPVSQLGPNYHINPASDLIPLCPNCHAMAHRFEPPASVEKLRLIRVT